MSTPYTFQLEPTYGAPLDARTVGTTTNRPPYTRAGVGLLRYETDDGKLRVCTGVDTSQDPPVPIFEEVVSSSGGGGGGVDPEDLTAIEDDMDTLQGRIEALEALNEKFPVATDISLTWEITHGRLEYEAAISETDEIIHKLHVFRGQWDGVAQTVGYPLGPHDAIHLMGSNNEYRTTAHVDGDVSSQTYSLQNNGLRRLQPRGLDDQLFEYAIFDNTQNYVTFNDGPVPVTSLGNDAPDAQVKSATRHPSNNYILRTYSNVRLNPGGTNNAAAIIPPNGSGEAATEKIYLSSSYVIVPGHEYTQDVVISGREPIAVLQWFADPSNARFVAIEEGKFWSKSYVSDTYPLPQYTVNFSNHGFPRDPIDIKIMLAEGPAGELWLPTHNYYNIPSTAWYDAADPATITLADGVNNVQQWSDKSGNNLHLVQATLEQMPVFESTGFNNQYPMLSFSSTNRYSNSSVATSIGSAPVTVTMVIKTPTLTDRFFFLLSGFNSEMALKTDAAGNVVTSYGTGTEVVLQGITPGSYLMIAMQRTESNKCVDYIYGVEQPHRDGTFENPFTVFQLNTSGGAMSDAGFAEVFVHTGFFNIPDRVRLEGYLAHKWGIADKLAEHHPFKTGRPIKSSVFN